ncbi:TPA: WecB/TagA/CpsF family glycosyltransferase, partial [Bacillus cereus]|nr:WecB/TagA/CpsF family glycosyltransferase [Bacillus cereus]
MKENFIGDIKVTVTDEVHVFNYLGERIENKIKSKVFFLNAHCFNVAQTDSMYKENLNSADVVLNDGIGIDIAAKLFGFQFHQNMNGTDFTPNLLRYAEEKGYTVYLLGGKPGVAEEAGKNLTNDLKNLQIIGVKDGYFFSNESDVLQDINQKKPDILIVGLGVPLQENWISEKISQLDVNVVVGVGAFLDFYSKRVTRAPKWMRNCKLEWLFRLLIEPRRLFKRYVIG